MKVLWRRSSRVALVLGLTLLALLISVYLLLEASLPQLEGEVSLAGLSDEVMVKRDAQGVPVVQGRNRQDVARALGFLHAQERFFQMDLQRRRSAGELSELVGKAALDLDKSVRLHRFRARAQHIVRLLSPVEQATLQAYTDGVNAGLQSLSAKPFEYFILRTEPEVWHIEDSLLSAYAMYFSLQRADATNEWTRALAKEKLPESLYAFLSLKGGEWDAPMIGGEFTVPAIPGATQLATWRPGAIGEVVKVEEMKAFPGSNNWAVAGSLTQSGAAMFANDMHLGISIPNTWFRAQLVYSDQGQQFSVVGVTLPGTPLMVVGSNGTVAWGFTNSYGDWSDAVRLQLPDEDHYLSATGVKPLQKFTETIHIKGEESVAVVVAETEWGPVLNDTLSGQRYAYRWVAHDVEQAINLNLMQIEKAQSVLDAVSIAKTARLPAQNFVTADKFGAVAWTIAGAIPRRTGFDGQLPESWASGDKKWEGYLSVNEYPEILNPVNGVIWTANARVVSGDALQKLGDGGYDLGARAQQIRDQLFELSNATEKDLLAIQLDDRALLLQRWHAHLTELLTDERVGENPELKKYREMLAQWNGRASADSVAYRLVRGFRLMLREATYRAWLHELYAIDQELRSSYLSSQWEGVMWRVVKEQPAQLLPPPYRDWPEYELALIRLQINGLMQISPKWHKHTYGAKNQVAIEHPLAKFLPVIGGLLRAPKAALNGDSDMPLVAGPDFGASERLVVTPGKEENGLFHMPTSQSGHPLSPYFMVGHEAWVKGEPTPLLPGEALYSLRLRPTGSP